MMSGKIKKAPKLRFPEFDGGVGWEMRKIGSMLAETPRPIELEDEADYCLVTVRRRYGGLVSRGILKGKEIKVNTQFLVRTDDFLISKRQIVHDACGLVSPELDGAVVSNEYSVLTAREGCSVEFIYWFAQQPCVSVSFLECSVGIVIEKMLFKLNLWLKREFSFPALLEQQKIADCLSSLDELIAAQSRKVEALKTHKNGLMVQLFPREGETQPRLRFPEYTGQWNDAALGDLCFNVSSGKDTRDSDGAFDLYGSTGIIGKTTKASYDTPHILVARVGANAGYLTKASGQFGVTDNTLVISLKPAAKIDYIFHYLGSININKLIFGSGQPLITGSVLKAQRVLLPSAAEQIKISNCLSSINALIKAEIDKLDSLNAHKKGLMQALFPSLEEAVL